MKPISYLILMLALLLVACSPKEPTSLTSESGEVVLGVLQHGFTLESDTREKFEEGLLLLHNFEYEDALSAFEAATAQDSTEVLTHWGEAMCHYKALWQLQNLEKGRAILSRLGDTKAERLASIEDPLKKAMWELVEIMYGDGQFEERNKKITTHLASLHQQYPQHQEIAAFYALSLIWATEEYGNGSEDLRLAASIADDILAVNPLHPGALHYKIHALDGPTSAENAHAAADAYAKVAADAAHALHMPSHIYLALGEWDGVVNSNQVSYQASVARMQNLELTDGARGYHSFAWLHYGLLQQGRYAEAEKILQDMLTYVPKDPTKGARGYLLGMQSRQLAENGQVSSAIQLDTDVKVDDIGLMAKSVRSFLRAQVAHQQEDTQTIQDEIEWLTAQTYIASNQVEDDGIAMCALGTSRYAPTENAVNSAKVVIAQMKGMKALLEGNEEQFETQMKQAVTLEEQTNYPAGPPRITKPSFEQYGEWLLTKGQYKEAAQQFESALQRMPKRTKALMGKMTAHRALGQDKEAERLQEEIAKIAQAWKQPDL
ncbi:MAG TPA: tetratricopeptide repeat protein [Saprospiraceae bacterium]|nr:tetratricopeptide repeat protein [Saprospiraceae bacterium]